jgi:hypothetical protein
LPLRDGPVSQIRDRPSHQNPSPKTALKFSSNPQIGYRRGQSKHENATPRWIPSREFDMDPKTVRIRKVSVNPDSDQKIQKCRGRDRGVVTKIFWALSKFKNWPRPSVSLSPKSALNIRLQITNSILDRGAKVHIHHSKRGPSRKFEIDSLPGTSL